MFEKWFKRRAQGSPEASPPAKGGDNPAEQQNQPESRAEPERQKKKLGAKLLGFLGIRRNQPEQRLPQPETPQPTTPESPAETEPVIEQAGRVRRFARLVLEKVLGAAEQEHKNAKKWDGEHAKPLDTEPLVEAADDLRHAVQDLDAAMPESPHTATAEHRSESYGSSPDGGNYVAAAPEFSPSFTVQVSQRIERRIQQLEEKIHEQSKQNERTAAFAAAGIGILAVAGVLMLGHEYLSHKKIKKEQKAIRKELEKQHEAQTAQEKEFARLQHQQTTEMARRERQAYYRDLSEFTHKQAEVTRGVAQEVKRVVPEQTLRTREPEQSEAAAWQRQAVAEQTVRKAAEWSVPKPELSAPERLEPLVRIETADTVEQGPSQQSAVGLVAGSGQPQAGGSPANGSVPLSPSAQRELKARQQRAQNLAANAWWMYGAVLTALLVGFAIIFVLVG